MKIRITESQLKSLIIEQNNNDFLTSVNKIDPSLSEMINTIKTSGMGETTILGKKGNIIRWVPSQESKNVGEFRLFKVKPEGGIPYLYRSGNIIYRGEKSGLGDIKVGSNFYSGGKVPSLDSYGKTTLERLNNIWSVSGEKTKGVLGVARQYVNRNKERFKNEFQKITRSQWAIKNWWNDNPSKEQNLAGSQYGRFLNKLNPLPKDIVERVIQDVELFKHLTYKAENFNSEGKYPNNPIKVPTPVV